MVAIYPLEPVRQKTHFTRPCHIIAQLGRGNSGVYTLAMTMVTKLNSHLSTSLLLLLAMCHVELAEGTRSPFHNYCAEK